jgi:hypothetical protein
MLKNIVELVIGFLWEILLLQIDGSNSVYEVSFIISIVLLSWPVMGQYTVFPSL